MFGWEWSITKLSTFQKVNCPMTERIIKELLQIRYWIYWLEGGEKGGNL